MKNIKKLLQLTIVLLAFSSQANAAVLKWVPVMMGDITTFVPYFTDDLPIPVDTSILLTSGQAQTNIADRGTYVHYKVYAHAGDVVKVDLYDMDANGNLYVKIGSQASLNNYDCKSENGGETHSTENDSCSITMPSDGYVYIAVHAPTYGCYTNVKHTVRATIGDNVDNYGQIGEYTIQQEGSENGDNVLYYPTNITNMNPKPPLIFMVAGGSNGTANSYQTLIKFIVSKGNAVLVAKGDFSAQRIINRLEDGIATYNQILQYVDTTRIGAVGHSTGGAHAFNVLKYFSDNKAYGSNGRFIYSFDPFQIQMTENELRTLPSNTNVIMFQSTRDGRNPGPDETPKILLKIYSLLDSIPAENKDYQVYSADGHGYISGGTFTANDVANRIHVLKPLDALMAYTFKYVASARPIALEVGSDTPITDGMVDTTVEFHGYHENSSCAPEDYPINSCNLQGL